MSEQSPSRIPSIEILNEEPRMAAPHIMTYLSRLAMAGSAYVTQHKIGLDSNDPQRHNILSGEEITKGVELALSDKFHQAVVDESFGMPYYEATNGYRAAILHELARAFRNTNNKALFTAFSRIKSSPYLADDRYDYVGRQPIPLSDEIIPFIIAAPEEYKLTTLAEMIDYYRWRHDSQASEEEKLYSKKELLQAIDILGSLQPGIPKELITILMRELCLKHGDMRTAEWLFDQLDPEIARILAWESGRDFDPKKIINGLAKSSKEYGDEIIGRLSIYIEHEIAISPGHSIIINISEDALANFLFDSHHILTTHEIASGMGGGGSRRNSEAMAGWMQATDVINPRPVYGTLVTDEEKIIGASNYGQVVIVMKPEVAERSTFTFGDSLNEHGTQPRPEHLLIFDDAKRVKDVEIAALKEGIPTGRAGRGLTRQRNIRYIESQILGGIEIDDVEEVILNLPQPGFITKLREAYPNMKLTVRVSEQAAENMLSQHPTLFEDNAKRIGNIHFIVIEEAGPKTNDGQQLVTKIRTLAASNDE